MQLCYIALEQSSGVGETRLEAGLHQQGQVRYALLLEATHVRLPCMVFQLVLHILIGKGMKPFAVYQQYKKACRCSSSECSEGRGHTICHVQLQAAVTTPMLIIPAATRQLERLWRWEYRLVHAISVHVHEHAGCTSLWPWLPRQ